MLSEYRTTESGIRGGKRS